MAVLLIIYESKDEQRVTKIVGAIKRRYRNCIRVTDYSYAVHTSSFPLKVFDQLKGYLTGDDHLYVIPLVRPYTGYGPRRVTEWLSDYLPAVETSMNN